jgi:hypothetical protein
MPHMNKSLILCVTIASLVAALPLGAQLEDDGSCSHEGGHYPEGTEMCRSGTLVRCESGAWGDIGLCHEDGESDEKGMDPEL